MIKSLRFLFLAFVVTSTTLAANSLNDLALLYARQDWSHFFAQAYLYRIELKKNIQSGSQINEAQLSPLILESIAYLKFCHFEMLPQLSSTLTELSQRKYLGQEASKTLQNDIRYLTSLASTEHQAREHLAVANQNIDQSTHAKRQLLWKIPSSQKAKLSSLGNILKFTETSVKNLCPKKEAANAKF